MKTKLMTTFHHPKDITWLEKTSEFSITWDDGHKTVLPFTALRKECPCALCRARRESSNPFQFVSERSPSSSLAKDISPVGHYAIKIKWADGHSSGIYTFEMLRNLCPCAQCKRS
ncbi:MAG: DUF971 domain-containing protein [Deltaproteobacteria bacterium]|nr:DUF971 domain-containing protein [Deltaproteobacteria bacterium]